MTNTTTVRVYGQDDWKEFLTARDSGEVVEIDSYIYYYFLDVLPPIFMNRTIKIGDRDQYVTFGFAEGYENIVAFWEEDGRYFCQRTERMNRG